MAVYVDPLMVWGGAGASRCFRFKPSCHMFADTLEELHALAKRIGMKRSWFQDSPNLQHYDLVASKRVLAAKYGAKEVSFKKMVRFMKKHRRK